MGRTLQVMEIRGYSSSIDSILGLPPTATKSEVEREADSRLVVRVETQSPEVRAVEEYLSGKVPEQGNRIVELIHKFIF